MYILDSTLHTKIRISACCARRHGKGIDTHVNYRNTRHIRNKNKQGNFKHCTSMFQAFNTCFIFTEATINDVYRWRWMGGRVYCVPGRCCKNL